MIKVIDLTTNSWEMQQQRNMLNLSYPIAVKEIISKQKAIPQLKFQESIGIILLILYKTYKD